MLHRPPIAVALLAIILTACTSELDEDVDCSDLCVDECPGDEGFPFDSYESCDLSPEQTFCGTDGAGADCIDPDFPLDELRVSQIHEALLDGEISCEWLTVRHLDRILAEDLRILDGAPPLNAFVHLNEAALHTARTLDEYHRCEGELAGPLHCAPFVIKTNYASKEVPVTNGSHALLDTQPTFDAFTVAQLRRSGAVLLGSTTMDEFARGAVSINGRSGKSGNAYDTRYNPGGSSAGSSVAVASNLAIAGLGTDNCSSLTVPAAYNSLVTLRSSHGLVSTQGIFPSNQLDAVAGPLTRTVEDQALFFDALSRFNPADRVHCADDMPRADTYTAHLDPQGLHGKRIGVLRSIASGDDERNPFGSPTAPIQSHYDDFIAELRSLGAEVVDDVALPGLPLNRSSSGMGQEVERFLARTEGPVTSVDELCETELYSGHIYDSVSACKNSLSRSDRSLQSNLDSGTEAYEANRAYVESVLDAQDLDALIYPADVRGAPTISGLFSNCILASVTGLPTMVVPAGFTSLGLPVGMSFTARMFDEPILFAMAYSYEQATLHRQPPTRTPSSLSPVMDISTFNDVHFDIGWAAFEEVLREGSTSDLTYQVFTDIAQRVLQDRGLTDLLESGDSSD